MAEATISFDAVGRLLRPRSVAVVGVSEDTGSMGGRTLLNLERFGFSGEIHLVSRTSSEVRGRRCLGSVDELPDGVDAAIIALPRQAVLPAIEACARRGVAGAVIYAAGFAEAGDEGFEEQSRLTSIARDADMAVLGPNTLGMTNYVDSVCLAFGPNGPVPPAGRPALAVIAQSGAMMGSLRLSAQMRRYAVTYAIATGNEAVTGVEDFLAHIIDDADTRAIAVFAEQLRRPAEFLALARRARCNGKPVVLLHPGRSAAARASAASHTGALAGDYEVMRTLVTTEAVVLVETLEEFLDAAEMLTRFPSPRPAGPAVLTDSGAIRGLTLDLAEVLELRLPPLSAGSVSRLEASLPSFAGASNPLDITAQGLKDMALYAEAAAALTSDPDTGSVLIAVMPGSPDVGMAKAKAILPALLKTDKPKAYVVLGDAPVDPDLPGMMQDNGIPFFRSPERALRAFAHSARYSALRFRCGPPGPKTNAQSPKIKGSGLLAEYVGKSILRDIGVAVPEGGLADSADSAAAIAERIGYPVVLKVQSPRIPHKTESGGVVIRLANESALRSAFVQMETRIARDYPECTVQGYLVETMGPAGLELVVGGRRDPQWGPVLLFGLGGIWVEVLNDVRLVSAEASQADVIKELDLLKAASLLNGSRGSDPVDKAAIASVVVKVGEMLRTHPEIVEIDINPLVVLGVGMGTLALDALIVVDDSTDVSEDACI